MALPTVDIEDVEILATGTHNGRTFTRKSLDSIVEAFDELKGKLDPPIKLGHDDSQKLLQADGYPAAGWITALRRAGDKLLATLGSVPKKIADLIEAQAYRKRSVEVYFDWKFDGKMYPVVLRGLALLGGDIPAVKTLDDIRTLYTERGVTLEEEKEQEGEPFLVVFEDPDADALLDELLGDLDRWLERAERGIKGKYGSPAVRTYLKEVRGKLRSMKATTNLAERVDLIWEETENQIRHRVREPGDFEDGSFRTITLPGKPGVSLIIGKLKGETTTSTQAQRFEKAAGWTMEKAKAWDEANAGKESEVTESEIRAILGLSEEADLAAVLQDLKAKAEKVEELAAKVTDLETKIAAVQPDAAKLTELETTVGRLVGDLAKRDAEGAVETALRQGKILPKQREWAMSFALRDIGGFATFVESQPKLLEVGSERGSSSDASADISPSVLEVGKTMGVSRADLEAAAKVTDLGAAMTERSE